MLLRLLTVTRVKRAFAQQTQRQARHCTWQSKQEFFRGHGRRHQIRMATSSSSEHAPIVHENRLAHEKSPYLLQHKNNPVDWYPWGEEAIAKARSENKPIFLSVGYSTCHWCHVMERESFENEATAQVMNSKFVNIKVDREERPDIDKIYMTFVQATTGSGGWPMSVFLVPDTLKPFFGGTYFPPRRAYGRPSFVDVLTRISVLWNNRRDELMAQGDEIMDAIREQEMEGQGRPNEAETIEDLQDIFLPNLFKQIARGYDPELGGFSPAPKFPRPVIFEGTLAHWHQSKDAAPLKMVTHTLTKMGEGGMYDHLGGGFHRYSVTRDWQVPHFEKMLYDQSQLVVSYLEAFQITQQDFFAKIARDTIQYVLRDMTAPEGGFYSAEDADSLVAHGAKEKSEGAFYIWSHKEISDILPAEDAKIFNQVYGIQQNGNVEPDRDPQDEFSGKNIVWKVASFADVAKTLNISEKDVASAVERSLPRLFEARKSRPSPHLDDKIIVAWNGMMISALCKAFQVLGDQAYLNAAVRAAEFIRRELFDEAHTVLFRNYRHGRGTVRAFADDYAALIAALLDLYESTFEIRWLSWALRLQSTLDSLFWDSVNGGYFSTEVGDPYHLLRMKEDYDGAEPSPNSVAALNLIRLANLLHNDSYRQKCRQLLECFWSRLTEAPIVLPLMTIAASLFALAPPQIVITGKPTDAATIELIRTVYRTFSPGRVLLLASGGEADSQLRTLGADYLPEGPGRESQAYVCEGFSCKKPTADPKELLASLTHEPAKEISQS